ncbi:MFS transporter [Bosea massiliensis]|uniref:MFS transporter n=1 Tax=Bosea massiliensis TaxID=151419 RepID=A0ABW0P9V2_9HYPH
MTYNQNPPAETDIAPIANSGNLELKRVVSSAALGQFVEWYDFVVYAYSATVIAALFFPSVDPTAALLSSLAVYGVGFLMRPLGGIVFGYLGDRIGRRNTLSAIILLMGGATVAIGLLPTYEQIGILAPVLLVVCRLIQGLSAAGEATGSNSFVAEHAPQNKRGFLVAFTYAFANLPPIVAALLVLLITNVLTPDDYKSWGWRIPFLLGAPLALVGLYIRRRTEESPAFIKMRATRGIEPMPLSIAFRDYKKEMGFSFALAALSSLGFYTLTGYFVTYLTVTAGLDRNSALISNSFALLIAFFAMLLGGYLSDRIGRRKTILLGAAISTLVCIPAYMLAGQGNLFAAILGQGLLALALGLFFGPVGIAFLELFPTRIRLSGAGVSYNVAYTVFGGTAPLLSAYLVLQTGNKLAPAFYMALVSIVVFIVALYLPETYRKSLVHSEDEA